MHGNDMRDIPTDRAAGIVTLASSLGSKGALVYYWVAHIVPHAICLVMSVLIGVTVLLPLGVIMLLPLLSLPITVRTLFVATRTYRANPLSPPWRGLERMSGGIHFVFGLLYATALEMLVSRIPIWCE